MQCPLYFGLLVYCYLSCFQALYRCVHCLPALNDSKSDEASIDCNTLSYLGNTGKKEINALASFPGSGNSWLRELLQRSTGLLTGSVYRDFELEQGGLPGVHDSSVLLVKTHQLPSEPFPTYDRAVVLIRNPFKTLLAEFNRRAAGHLGYVPITKQFLQRKDWVEFVMVEVKNWTRFYIKWLDFKRPLLLVNYEHLLLDAHCQLERIIHFLRQPVYHRRLFECSTALTAPTDRFKRAEHGHLYPFDPFSIRVNGSSLRKLVDRERRTVYRHITDRLGDRPTCERREEQGV